MLLDLSYQFVIMGFLLFGGVFREVSPLMAWVRKGNPKTGWLGYPLSQSTWRKCGQGMIKICREAAYLNKRFKPTSAPPALRAA
jgi:hypothetical protein